MEDKGKGNTGGNDGAGGDTGGDVGGKGDTGENGKGNGDKGKCKSGKGKSMIKTRATTDKVFQKLQKDAIAGRDKCLSL